MVDRDIYVLLARVLNAMDMNLEFEPSVHDIFLAFLCKEMKMNEGKLYCSVCGKEISAEEYESYDGLCWECWDDQMTEECEFEEDII